jgi:aspartyl-tRNA(Asn)/glutamyl-tRNA(Gln) amidotransferase subunit A
MNLPSDPFNAFDIAGFGVRLRRGAITAEAVTCAYLERIAMLDPQLGAFTHVANDRAIEQARGVDRMLAAGTDLGPLMGVPVAVKDLFTVDGMPLPKCGSEVEIGDLIEAEGSFIRKLKRAGCVILGKTRMTEFAFGLVNVRHRTPWNPCDAKVHRMPGGSSSGSAVALAAGLCAFSIGSDTGGSVRQPAALCGLFGHKTTFGLWPTDGVFPLSPTMDSIGPFTRFADDAALVFGVLTGCPVPQPRRLKGLRLGRPVNHFFDGVADEVLAATEHALRLLQDAGVEIVPIEVPEAAEIDTVFAPMLSAELLATLGAARFTQAKEMLDPIVWNRAEPALRYSAIEYIRLQRRQRALCRIAEERMRGLDGWISPTTPDVALPLADYATPEKAAAWIRRGTNDTRPANLFGQCAVSIPIPLSDAPLPVGLQIACGGGRDVDLLSMAMGIENLVGRPALPDMSQFLQ